MYSKVQFKRMGGATAFLAAEFKEDVRAPGNYIIPALWISARSSTRGSLVIGEIHFFFADPAYHGLSYMDVLQNAGKERAEDAGTFSSNRFIRNVTPHAFALMGPSSLWGDSRAGVPERMAKLVAAYRTLPTLTTDYDGWFKLY